MKLFSCNSETVCDTYYDTYVYMLKVRIKIWNICIFDERIVISSRKGKQIRQFSNFESFLHKSFERDIFSREIDVFAT